VKTEIERGGARVDLDLQELDLVNVEGARFLNRCERRVPQCCAVRLMSGVDAPGTRVDQKHPPISATGERLVGKRRWKAGLERFRRLYKW
jgi:hypothetical protein